MKPTPKELGRWGESQAALYLEGRGYTIVERNFRTPYGEIDLVARDQNSVVFVEVKTRSSSSYGMPEESITASKATHMLDAARFYIEEHPALDCIWRVDVIAIQWSASDRSPQIVHFKNALT